MKRLICAVTPLLFALSTIWVLALTSHLDGNPTAINALVAIPLSGLLICAAICSAVKLADIIESRNDGCAYDHEARQWVDVAGRPVPSEPAADLYWPDEDTP